jgi:PhzF family phenazine biosynthesis protein
VRIRTVDAFTDKAFAGNPAAVVVLDQMPPEDWMRAVAREMNLSETAFVVRAALPDADYQLRWFTPTVEVDLCGHATLASAHCLFEDGASGPLRFSTRSGVLTVARQDNGMLEMDFPVSPPVEVDARAEVEKVLGVPVRWTGCTDLEGFLLAVLADEATVRALTPDMGSVATFGRPLIVTAEGSNGVDFVSRVFAPTLGIPEDPVTGSSHTLLAPFWSHQMQKTAMTAHQVSARGGVLGVELVDDRVLISGRAVTVLDGQLSA